MPGGYSKGMRILIPTLLAVATFGAALPVNAQPLTAEQRCQRHIQETSVILDAMSQINLAVVSDQAAQNSIDFGAMAIVYIEDRAKKYCPGFVQITLKQGFLKQWNLWMEQLNDRKPAGYGGGP